MNTFKISFTIFLSINMALLFIFPCYSENLSTTATQYSNAILKYETELIDDQQNPKLYHNLANFYYATGDKKKAKIKFQKAKELYLAQGNIEAALQLETTVNTLTFSEAMEKIEKRFKILETNIKKINKVLENDL